jgi:hypothetical protein
VWRNPLTACDRPRKINASPLIQYTTLCWRRNASIQPIFRSWRSIFWQSYEETQVQKIRHTIHHTIKKKSIFVPVNPSRPQIQYRNSDIALFAWLGAPYKFWILYSKISHETNTTEHWKSSYKKTICSLGLREHAPRGACSGVDFIGSRWLYFN